MRLDDTRRAAAHLASSDALDLCIDFWLRQLTFISIFETFAHNKTFLPNRRFCSLAGGPTSSNDCSSDRPCAPGALEPKKESVAGIFFIIT